MTLRANLRKRIVGAVLCVAVLLIISPSVLAAEPHENPETAEVVFSGIALFRYYSDSLDFVLQKDPAEVEARLEKMPFANVPQSLRVATDRFAVSSISISHLVVAIDEDLGKLRALREQFRLNEATELATQISQNLSQANRELERIEQAIENIGAELKVSSAPEGSDLRRAYNQVLDKIDKIKETLDLYQSFLMEAVLAPESLSPTEITLQIQPTVAFVGDNVRFQGVLASEGGPLAGREVDILVNSSRYVTVRTDALGSYQGMLQIPYWYIPELEIQALYYPRDRDIGVYLASLSPVVKVKVLFYEAELEVTVEDKAYPGVETTVTGRFDYGESPPLNERKVEIYFDDVLITEAVAQEAFAQKIKVDPEADIGEHIITVSSAAVGRYSPVVASAILNVTKATPILDLRIPKVAMIPGSVGLEGRLYSEVGQLNRALIKMRLGKSHLELVSSEDGTFETKIGVGMGLGLIGSQELIIQVLPKEPWHASLSATSSVLMVNVVNCGAFFAVLLFLGIYLPGRLRKRLGVYARLTARPVIGALPQERAPAYTEKVTIPARTEKSEGAGEASRVIIFSLYRLVVRALQIITKALLGPQVTLREFAYECSKALGPAGKYFIEFTRMIERLLYSQYRPTEEDVEKSQQLSRIIVEESKSEGI